MRRYTAAEAAPLLGLKGTGLKKWIRMLRSRTGVDVPGRVDGYLTDESIMWIREERERRGEDQTPGLGRPIIRPHVDPVVTGLTPASREPDPEALWEREIARQQRDESKVAQRYSQEVVIPDKRPVLLVLLSDLHLGNTHCDVSSAKADAELIRDTPGVYGAILGDCVDNWIGQPNIMAIQREQPIPHAEELALFRSWISILAPKLVAAVAGNHEARTYAVAGVDLLMDALRGVTTLYDANEIRFTLRLGTGAWRCKLRHKWLRRSQYNATHGPEFDAKFFDGRWDIAVGGHTHAPTVFREFFDHAYDHRVKLAVQLGSYELDSAYGRQLGLPRSVPGGSAGIMLWPSGDMQPWRDLQAAVRFLAEERK